jgi:hypothetical protein
VIKLRLKKSARYSAQGEDNTGFVRMEPLGRPPCILEDRTGVELENCGMISGLYGTGLG